MGAQAILSGVADASWVARGSAVEEHDDGPSGADGNNGRRRLVGWGPWAWRSPCWHSWCRTSGWRSADDARFNDGCPAVNAKETTCNEASCIAPLYCDNDSDGFANDGCPLAGGISEFCVVSVAGSGVNDYGPCSDSIGDACEVGADITSVNGDYDKDFPRVAVCIGAADSDAPSGDGWCDATETLLGSNPALASSVPEYKGLDYPIDPAPQSCSNLEWYASGTDPIGDGAPIDDDGDTLVNAADWGCQSPAAQCLNSTNDDPADDAVVNDGCPQVGSRRDCDTDVVPDGDCTDPGEAALCGDGLSSDGADDPLIDDGCAQSGSLSEGTDTDNDGTADIVDNCVSVYNPDQTNSDTVATGGGDALGDACDPNDDGDGLIDTAEWARGSDAKHPFSPFMLDIDGNTSVQGADASALKAWIGTSVGTLPPLTQVTLP